MTIHDLAEYEILDEHRVEDVQSDGFILRHKKSGARIAILSNNEMLSLHQHQMQSSLALTSDRILLPRLQQTVRA